jgi:hypothetical protein
VMLKANGYVARDWVYNVKQTPIFLDGEWNRERRSLGLSPSISVPYPRTSSLSAKTSYGHNTYRNEQNSYGNDTYGNGTYGNDTYRNDTHRNDRRSRPPRRDTYDERSRSRSRSRSRGRGRDHRRSRRSRSPSRGRDPPTRYRDKSPTQNEVFLDRIVQGVVQSLLAKEPNRPYPSRSPPRHSHLDQRAPPVPSNLRQTQQAHSALPRSRRDDTPRSVNQRARPAPSRRTDLGVSDPMNWQPHTQSHGSDLNAQNRQGRPELAKITSYKTPGPEGQGRPELAKITSYKTPGPEGQEPPAMPQSTTAPSDVDQSTSAREDSPKLDINLESN